MRFITLYVVLFLISVSAYAQSDAPKTLSGARTTTLADTGELQYDIKYVRFNLNMTNLSTYISGDVSTTAIVSASSMSTYVFELNDTLTIDSFKINGTLQTVATTLPSTRRVTLTTALLYGTVFTAQVFYHGYSPTGTGFFTHGVTHNVSTGGSQMTYTCGDPNWCSDWWPCKQVLEDKIDSVDMWVTVPTGTIATSNGLKLSATSVSGGIQYHWKTRYAIDYYLIAVDVAPYVEYDSYIHYTGSTDSTLFQNFFYDTSTFIAPYKKNFDSAALIVDYLSQVYGRYPYDKEKFGYSYTTLAGGMENQTLVTIGVPTTTTIAHELGHQWFGDHVTYASWRDIWLSEGFASYTEQLFVEHFWGTAAMVSYRIPRNNTVTSQPSGSVYVDDTTNVYRIFDGRLTYYKGAAVAHMLRYIAADDSTYFRMLRRYQNTYAFGLATTESLKAIAASAYGTNLDTFFNQWIYKQGYPIYKAKWNWKDSIAYVQLIQTTSDTSVSLFHTPIDIQLISATGDTIIKVYNDLDTQLYSFRWNRAMSNMQLDPNYNVLHKMTGFGPIIHDTTVGLPIINVNNIKVYPNPAKETWRVTAVAKGILLTLTDMKGNVVWKGISEGTDVFVSAKELQAGNYILHIANNNHSTFKLVHW